MVAGRKSGIRPYQAGGCARHTKVESYGEPRIRCVVDVTAQRREDHRHRGPRQGPQPEWAETRRILPKASNK
jgi:hypothetical protein